MKQVAITTLGCKTNQFESAAMIEQFVKAGYDVVPFSESADIYVINSCTVTAKTDAETRRLIRRARRLNPQARIIATGCYAQVAAGDLERMPEVDSVLGNMEKQDIAHFVEAGKSHVSDIATEQSAGTLELSSFAEHTRAFLQIQNGCNSFCSYCIVPYARGRSRSVPVNQVLEGIRNLAANGYQELVLTGIHLGAYGLDLATRASLTELVAHIESSGLVPRLRIGSIEPNELDDELISLMSRSAVICPHLHLPLQSGSNAVLKRMGRHYTESLFGELIAKVTAALPDVFLGADVIAGFPGETEEEFAETFRLIQDLPFSDLHIFPYSRRPGTKAAELPGQVPTGIVKKRAEELRNLASKKKREFLTKQTGRKLQVLVQGYDAENGLCRGLARNYATVSFAGNQDMRNREIEVLVTGLGPASDLTAVVI
ncbi:MAG TPA: tRNA (N(6)-L-threonylcarbamoyladenosine(37)-C(2))-methylthiotransferase MtaB [Desulfuromonadaceae bacterium]|jgi:threonylcarbamoyladenosine tRNA methylthiotransferase MtaB